MDTDPPARTPAERAWYDAAMNAIITMDRAALTTVVAATTAIGGDVPDQVTRYMNSALIAGGHDVQQFWLGQCTCHRATPQIQIAMCWPVTISAQLAALLAAAGQPPPPRYPGSVVSACTRCADPVWVGPRLQAALTTNTELQLLCYLCASRETDGHKAAVMDLGNTP